MFQDIIDLYKAKSHKYTHKKRVYIKGKPAWRYFYKEHHGKGATHVDDLKEGEAFKVNYEGNEGHFHIDKVDGDNITVIHDETKEKKTLTKRELRAVLQSTHAEALKANVKKKEARLKNAKSEKAKKNAKRRLEQARKKAKQEDNFDTMPEKEEDKARLKQEKKEEKEQAEEKARIERKIKAQKEELKEVKKKLKEGERKKEHVKELERELETAKKRSQSLRQKIKQKQTPTTSESKQLQAEVKGAVKDIEYFLNEFKKTSVAEVANQAQQEYVKALESIAGTTAQADFEREVYRKIETIKITSPLLTPPDYLDLTLRGGTLYFTITEGQEEGKRFNTLTDHLESLNFRSTTQNLKDLKPLEKQIIRRYLEDNAQLINEFLEGLPDKVEEIEGNKDKIRIQRRMLEKELHKNNTQKTEVFFPISKPEYDKGSIRSTKGSAVEALFSIPPRIPIKNGKLDFSEEADSRKLTAMLEATAEERKQKALKRRGEEREAQREVREKEKARKEKEEKQLEEKRKERERKEKEEKARQKEESAREYEEYQRGEKERLKKLDKEERESRESRGKEVQAKKKKALTKAKLDMNLEVENMNFLEFALSNKTIQGVRADKEYIDTYNELYDLDLLKVAGKKLTAQSGEADYEITLLDKNQKGRFQLAKNSENTLVFLDTKQNEFLRAGGRIENTIDSIVLLTKFKDLMEDLNKRDIDLRNLTKSDSGKIKKTLGEYLNYPVENPNLEDRVKHARELHAIHKKQIKLEENIKSFNSTYKKDATSTELDFNSRDLQNDPLSQKQQQALNSAINLATKSKNEDGRGLNQVHTSSEGELFASNGHIVIMGKKGTSTERKATAKDQHAYIGLSKNLIQGAKSKASSSFSLSANDKDDLIKILATHQGTRNTTPTKKDKEAGRQPASVVFEEDSINLIDDNGVSLYKLKIQLETSTPVTMNAGYLRTALLAGSKNKGATIRIGSGERGNVTPAVIETDLATSAIMPKRY